MNEALAPEVYNFMRIMVLQASSVYCVLKTKTDSLQSARCGQMGLNGYPTGANSKARGSGQEFLRHRDDMSLEDVRLS
ncbi:hypothetical protein DAPPUDRAFT_244714 [Daphnia pulex]|uniref:Uncharacterized protein n=1 Tax=Daphnia pulex TaxID=6669 RepID=E9GLM1_DAPPU|nr:hypothetical protein DAPPUDRAFT_244714 [Daphnia pulex]|eukprot:EFX79666.1 hypothetical protein DAPPUDRAFT_244714 [Daphnia pulex]